MTVAVALLQPGWADWEAGPVLALLRRELKVQIEIATPDGEPETSIGGILAASDYRFDDPVLSDADLFIAIGSDAWTEGANKDALRRIWKLGFDNFATDDPLVLFELLPELGNHDASNKGGKRR